MSETRNTAVLKTNGIVWRNVRNRNVRFFPIFIFAAYCQCRQFDDNLATAIRHCICAMFSAQVRASISTCDAIFIRGLQNQSLYQVRINTNFRIWYQNVQPNLLCLVPVSTMLYFARIILQRAKCAITLRTMHELRGADSTM